MLTALMLGRRFSILTMWDAWQPLYRKTLSDLDLYAQCASVRSASLTPDNRNLLAGKEDDVFPRLEAVARDLHGAERREEAGLEREHVRIVLDDQYLD